MQELTGALNVDATRGYYNRFVVQGRQLVLPEKLFQMRQLTPNQLYDRSAPPGATVARELTKEGRELWNRLTALGGKGVTITGEPFDRLVAFTQDFTRPQLCFEVHDVKAEPSANPPLEPFLAELLRQKEEREAREKEEKEVEARRKREEVWDNEFTEAAEKAEHFEKRKAEREQRKKQTTPA